MMDTLKIRVRINADAAIRAGRNQAGEVLVPVPLDLTEAQRETLLSLPRDKYAGSGEIAFFDFLAIPKILKEHHVTGVSFDLPAIPDASDQSVKQLLDAYPRVIEAFHNKLRHVAAVAADKMLTERTLKYQSPWMDEVFPDDLRAALAKLRQELKAEEDARTAKRAADYEKQKEREAEQRRQKEEKEERAKAAREAWIANHGSERLKRLVAEKIEYGAVYRDERLALERPGWEWETDLNLTYTAPRNPPQEALDLIVRARVSDPECYLRYFKLSVEDGYNDWHEYGYLVLGKYMGKDVVYKERLKTGDDEPDDE